MEKQKISLELLMKREGAIYADTRYDTDGWAIRLVFKGGKTKDIKLAINADLEK